LINTITKEKRLFFIQVIFYLSFFLCIFFPERVEGYTFYWGDLILDNQYGSMKRAEVDKVLFPHWLHRIRYKCKACHPLTFKMKKGVNHINMKGIIAGKWCGKCHNGKIAFSPKDCARCHRVTEKKEKEILALLERPVSLSSSRKTPTQAPDSEDEEGEEDDDDDEEEEDEDEEEADSPFQQKWDIEPDSNVYRNLSGELGSVGRPDLIIGIAAKIASLPRPQALAGLPVDKFGLVDWAAAVREKKIAPIAGIEKFNKDKFEDYVITLHPKSDHVDKVIFPHDVHTYHIDCDNCHPRPFIPKKGKNPAMRMEEFKQGRWCGKCHGRVAFPLDECTGCHISGKGLAMEMKTIEKDITKAGIKIPAEKITVSQKTEPALLPVKKSPAKLLAPAEIKKTEDGMVLIKGGCFKMGSPRKNSIGEFPLHKVCVDDFYLGDHEVTQKEWKKITRGKNPSYRKGGKYPVEQVSWFDVQKYIKELNRKTGKNYRLPTEAEWEYAARGGASGKPMPTNNEEILNKYTWNFLNSDGQTHKTKSKEPNELGLHDMFGNVWEWCADFYDPKYYAKSPVQNPKGPKKGNRSVVRGGSWSSPPADLRPSKRGGLPRNIKGSGIGFRLARDAK